MLTLGLDLDGLSDSPRLVPARVYPAGCSFSKFEECHVSNMYWQFISVQEQLPLTIAMTITFRHPSLFFWVWGRVQKVTFLDLVNGRTSKRLA